MASVKVFPRLDKVNSEGKTPIYLRLIKNRKSKYIALDVYIFSGDWNKVTSKVKSTAVNASQINSYISSKIAEAERIALELETKSIFVTAYDIKHKILGKAPADFFEYFENRKDIIDKEAQLVSDYKKAYAFIQQDNHFSADEINHIYNIYSGMINQSVENLNQITVVINAFVTQMSDADRLRIIDAAGERIDKNYEDCRLFTQENILLSLERSKDLNDLETVKKLYGIQ